MYVLKSVILLVLMFSGILLIISSNRYNFEKSLKRKYRIEREWWVPPLILFITLSIGIVELSDIYISFLKDLDIIILIFTLAFVARGLAKSNFFEFISYKFVSYANGNTMKLIIYLFLLTSVTTLFTTNDIVILILTPIFIEISFQTKIKNLLPILLSQFIVANTLSMGLLIGSPTNIIISEQSNINFLEYFTYMIIPTIVSFFTIFLIFYMFIKISEMNFNILNSFKLQDTYNIPEDNFAFTSDMKYWIIIFIVLVILISITTFYNYTLYLCSIPVFILSLFYWNIEYKTDIKKPISKLPYGVFFFGMSFFIFAEAFSSYQMFNSLLSYISDMKNIPFKSIPIGIVGSGILVNIFNDIPASALIAQLLSEITFNTKIYKIITYQSILIGLNIGKYITQIGSLAGILWFSIINLEYKKHKLQNKQFAKKLKIPSRMDLVKYGIINFITCSIVLIATLLIEYYILSTYSF